MEKIEDKIIDMVSRFLQVDKSEVKRSSHLFEDFNADKMALADLYLSMQQELAVKIPTQSFEQAKTVDDLIKLVEENSNELIE